MTGGSGFIGGEIALAAIQQGHAVGNLDIAAPHFPGQDSFWTRGDVRDLATFQAAVEAFRPDILIHLASDTDVQITRMDQFTTTLDGTANAIRVAQAVPGLAKFIHISTQFTVRPGIAPRDETHLEPYTVYGEAKAQTERMVRNAALAMPWLIVRPTIIWGPHHPSFRENIFRHIGSRNYLHPVGREKTMRAFGYVTNTARQILTLALLPETDTGDRHVFYVGDETIDYDRWADAFSVGMTGKPARRIPIGLLNLMGRIGDMAKALRLPAPIDSGRAFRMSTSSAIDLSPTLAVTGPLPVSFEDGVASTLAWIKAR